MPKQLYVVRHGIAIARGAWGGADETRPLTPKGKRRMRQVARSLRRLGVEVDRIVTSPVLRARQTAEILLGELEPSGPLENSSALHAESDPITIREWLANQDSDRLMIVGHNPSISELIAVLTTGASPEPFVDLGKGAVAALAELSSTQQRYRLDWLLPARLIRCLGRSR